MGTEQNACKCIVIVLYLCYTIFCSLYIFCIYFDILIYYFQIFNNIMSHSFRMIIFVDNLFCIYVLFCFVFFQMGEKYILAYFNLRFYFEGKWLFILCYFPLSISGIVFTLILYNLLTIAIPFNKFYILDYLYLWFYFEIQDRPFFPWYLSKRVECKIRYYT